MRRWVPILIATNVAIYLLQLMQPWVTQDFLWVPAFALERPWTAVTYMFLHDPNSIMHIGFNMLALYIFGPRVEARIGGARFLGLYFTSGIAGALACFYMPLVSVVGASGAILGVSLAYARYWPRDQVYIYGIIPMTTRTMVIVYAVISVGGVFFNFQQGVAHLGHLGGFAGGYLYCLWMERFTGARSFRAIAEGRRSTPVVALPIGPTPVERAALERWARIPADALHPVNREELERIRGKIAATGPRSLTSGELEFLERFSGLAS